MIGQAANIVNLSCHCYCADCDRSSLRDRNGRCLSCGGRSTVPQRPVNRAVLMRERILMYEAAAADRDCPTETRALAVRELHLMRRGG
jgi:hypothetical protein